MSVSEMPVTDTPAEGQVAAARSLPDNDKAVWPTGRWTVPAGNYIDPERYALEQQKIFRRYPVPIAPSALVAPGGFMCWEAYGEHLILSRAADGALRVFFNACRHRGSRLVTDDEPHRGRVMVCPYHAWAYDLTGRLVSVPREEAFEGFDKSDYGLVQVEAREAGGLIWASLDRSGAPADFSNVTQGLVEELDALGLAGMHQFGRKTYSVAGNWKLIMDTFLEGYHVTRLHKDSLGTMFEDTIPTVGHLGPHMRRTAGRLNFVQSNVGPAEHSMGALRRVVVFVYNIFPSAVLVCSPTYVNLLIMIPEAVDRTRVENFMLTNHAPRHEKDQDRWQRSFDLTVETTFPEDFSAAENSQKGLSTGVVPELLLCGIEEYISTFHKTVDEFLARS